MRRVFARPRAATLARGPSPFTAALGSRAVMHPATHPGLAGQGGRREDGERRTGVQGWALIVCLLPFSAPMDTNLLSNIQKLFSERIDVFSPVEFNKV